MNNFNFLRLVFATLVLLSHAFELVDGNRSRELLTRLFGTISFGEFAVDGFFLLSGYLIVKSWDTQPKITVFLSKRILRIYPGFIVAAIVSAVIVGPLGADSMDYFSRLDIKKLPLNMLRLAAPAVPPVFTGQPYAVVNGAMWTISYEFGCYLSVLVLGMSGLIKHKSGWLLVTLAFTGAFAAGILFNRLHIQPSVFDHAVKLEKPFIRLGMFFFSGGTYYLLREQIRFRPVMAVISGFLLSGAMFYWATAELVLATLGGYLLFYFAFSKLPLLQPFQTLPDVSYGLYLYGWPIQKLLIWYFPALPAAWVFIFSVAIGILAGLLSWLGVEKRFLRLKSRNSSPVAREELHQAVNKA